MSNQNQTSTSSGKVEENIDRALAQLPVLEFSSKAQLRFASESAAELLGFEDGELPGRGLDELVFDEPDAFWNSARSLDARTQRVQLRNKAGEPVELLATCQPTGDGRAKGLAVVLHETPEKEGDPDSAGTEAPLNPSYAALLGAHAIIEFDLRGYITAANDNFLAAVGYSREDVLGKHHEIFCDPDYAASAEYVEFWRRLGAGEAHSGEIRRRNSRGDDVWLQAKYSPIVDAQGQPTGVIKVATDITEAKRVRMALEAKIDAVSRTQAVIEFDLSGRILDANENFLAATGYTLDEIAGQHHRIFCTDEYAQSADYAKHWEDLKQGIFKEGCFERRTRSGDPLWIQASYNPVYDENGELRAVVKFASDVTEAVLEEQGRAEREERERNEWLSKQVVEVLDAISAAGEGDLTVSIDYEGGGPVGELALGLNAMITSLRGVVGATVEGAMSVSAMAMNISGEIATMAKEADGLGATSEEMSANVEELTASIASIAKSGRDADELAKGASSNAHEGSIAVKESMEAMEAINGSASEIGEIVKVIGEIASQTNLLAFNAAIEAARAGQHGRGFAVVADEVRKLAERSSEATKEISKLIQESTSRITRGARVSEKASDAFRQIVQGVENTYAAINQIASGADEQASAAQDVNSGIQSVSEATERAAHSCEEVARACDTLTTQAGLLQELVSKFTV